MDLVTAARDFRSCYNFLDILSHFYISSNVILNAIMNAGKGAVLASLKSKMQTLRDELDGVKDQLDQKCKDNETLVEEKNQVLILGFSAPSITISINHTKNYSLSIILSFYSSHLLF